MISSQPRHTTTVQFLANLLETFGVVNFYRKDAKWRNILQETYCCVQYGALFLFILFHFLSTVTRSIHYVPHFLECLSEDVFILSLLLEIFINKCKYKQLNDLMTFMDHILARTDNNVIIKYKKTTKKILMVIGTVSTCTSFFIVIASILPRTEEEAEVERKVYGTKFPQRRLPFRMKIPWIDETETANYILIYVYQVYIVYIINVLTSLSLILMPILILFLKHQYSVLGEFTEKIGQRHYSLDGNEIYHTKIARIEKIVAGHCVALSSDLKNKRDHGESSDQSVLMVKECVGQSRISKFHRSHVDSSNQSVISKEKSQPIRNENKGIHLSLIQGQSSLMKQSMKVNDQNADRRFENRKQQLAEPQAFPHRGAYQQNYVNQIIKYHHIVLLANEKMSKVFYSGFSIRTTGIFVTITLLFLQFITHVDTYGGIQWSSVCKLCLNMLQGYLTCYFSDMLNECNTTLCRCIRNSHWHACNSRVRKDVLILLRRAQRSNHLVFYRGVVVLRPAALLTFNKFSYSFINCFRAKTGF